MNIFCRRPPSFSPIKVKRVNSIIDDNDITPYISPEETKSILIDTLSEYNIPIKQLKSNYNKEYYIKNKSKRKERIICHCGKLITRDYMKKHLKTKAHLNKISLLEKS